jgi:tetratricopeptide (TPR) repeat protein
MDGLSDASKAIECNSNNAKAYFRRGNIHNSLKYYEEAKYDFVKVKEIDPCLYLNKAIRISDHILMMRRRTKQPQRKRIITKYLK